MGTKGKRNTPITARVNAGLFNQKKGITEPLLNVGPAGVYGDNQTRDIPSPSKIKGYSMKASPFKQKADEGDIKVITPGEDTTKKITVPGTPGTENLDKLNEGKKDLGPDFKPTQAQTDAANKEVADAKAKDTAAAKPTEKTVVVKGKPRERPVQTRDAEDTQTARERSNTVRGGSRMNRKEKNAAIKEAKAQAKIDNPDDRKARRKAKLTQAQKDRKLTAASGAGAQRQAEQNRSISARKTGTVKSNERNLRESDMSESTKNTLVDKDLGVDTTTQTKTNPTEIAGVSQKEIDGVDKKTPGFFKTKSPMKKNYFK
jgi:hypothetical protein